MKLASTAGGIEGAGYGLTGSDSLSEVPQNVAIGAAAGAVLPVGLHYGAMGTKWAARPLTDKFVPMYDATKSILSSKLKLTQLTYDPNLSNMKNIWNKVTGKGSTIDDVLNKENQRLARQAAKAEKIGGIKRNPPEKSYIEQDVSGLGNMGADVRRRWEAGENVKGAINAPLSFNEYIPNMENANRFHQAMSDFKRKAGAKGEQVYQYSPEEYANMRTFMTDDAKTGFAIKDDGDIVSVFNGGNKGAIDSIMPAATSAGGTKLDAYDTFLPEIYSRHGFKEVGRDIWNEEFKSPRWNKSYMRRFNLGEPDVVYMEYDPSYYGGYQSPNSLQNVVNRLNDNISNQKVNIKNIWKPQKQSQSYTDRPFLEALADGIVSTPIEVNINPNLAAGLSATTGKYF